MLLRTSISEIYFGKLPLFGVFWRPCFDIPSRKETSEKRKYLRYNSFLFIQIIILIQFKTIVLTWNYYRILILAFFIVFVDTNQYNFVVGHKVDLPFKSIFLTFYLQQWTVRSMSVIYFCFIFNQYFSYINIYILYIFFFHPEVFILHFCISFFRNIIPLYKIEFQFYNRFLSIFYFWSE